MKLGIVMKIGIVGGGFVGSATRLLACDAIESITYDIDPSRCHPAGTTLADLKSCDFVFVCVPTPTYPTGQCNTRIVEKCIESLKAADIHNIILRSTVPPGTSDRLGVLFMPEFLTEKNWTQDFRTCSTWIFGVPHSDKTTRDQLKTLISLAHSCGAIENDTTLFVEPKEAELIKYTRNNFLAMKIGFSNEIYRLCQAIGANYETVQEGFASDPRIGLSHTGVPGYDGRFGFGGTCLPKDTAALSFFMHQVGTPSPIIDAVVYRNKELDRPERDWEADPRAFTKQ